MPTPHKNPTFGTRLTQAKEPLPEFPPSSAQLKGSPRTSKRGSEASPGAISPRREKGRRRNKREDFVDEATIDAHKRRKVEHLHGGEVSSTRPRKKEIASTVGHAEVIEVSPGSGNKSKARKAKRRQALTDPQPPEPGQQFISEQDIQVEESAGRKLKRKRKTKEEKEAEAMPLAARSKGLCMFLGAHVSAAKGVHNSVTNALHIGGNAFAMFLKSQRKWENPPLQDDHCDLFRANCKEHSYDCANHILPHGSYLVNLAQEDPEKARQAYDAFVDDLHRCEALGITLYNFHPGWTGGAPRSSAIGRIASALNRAIASTNTVVPVIETMAGSGNVIGSTFEDLRDILSLVENNQRSRVGVCIDTCHVFAAGYDLRSPKAFKDTMEEFDRIVGLKYLRALHLNDSKAPLASHRDLHQNIGLGFLGLSAFHSVCNFKRFENLPLVLETPIDKKDENGRNIEDKSIWAREIKLLESLIGMDAESDQFKKLESDLADQGTEERKKFAEAFEKKKEKERKKAQKVQTTLPFGQNINADQDEKETEETCH